MNTRTTNARQNSYKLQKIIRLKMAENDNISTWGIKQTQRS